MVLGVHQDGRSVGQFDLLAEADPAGAGDGELYNFARALGMLLQGLRLFDPVLTF